MTNWRLYNVAKRYIEIIEKMEQTKDKQSLADLEEQRVTWHNKFIETLRKEGIAFRDREHVTRLAYLILRGES